MAYNYVVTSQKPTAVSVALVCCFTGKSDQNLVLAKGNRIEIHTLTPEGLLPILDVPLYGRITAMAAFRPPTLVQDVLFVLTERKHFCILSFDNSTRRIVTRTMGNLRDKVGRDLETGSLGLIDPDNRVIGIFLYEGLMKIITILNTGYGMGEAFNVRIDELKFLDVKFLFGCPRPTICVLYEDNRNCRHIKTYVVDVKDKDVEAGPWNQSNVEHGSKLLIPIPFPTNGVVVIGQSTITYLSGSGKIQSLAIQYNTICAYGAIDSDGSRYLLGDATGALFVLVLHRDNSGATVSALTLDILGNTSIASSLCYLDNGIVFVGSTLGDSQLIKLLETQDESSGSHVDVLQAYPNIGPILDMCVVEGERSGQSYVVTCSGAFKDGSLRVVRSGIGIEEQASIELQGIKGVWSLRENENSPYDKYLVQSFIGETRTLSMAEDQLEEADIPGFGAGQTLFCANMSGGLLVQVTATAARLVDSATLGLVTEFGFAPSRATGATATATQLVVSVSGGEVLYLEVRGRDLQRVSGVKLEHDVACMSIRPLHLSGSENLSTDDVKSMAIDDASDSGQPSSRYDAGVSELLAVAMWTDNSVRLLALPGLIELSRTGLELDVQARDILLLSLPTLPPLLLVGLGDGMLVIYTIDVSSGVPCLSGRRRVVLGTQPLAFSCFRHGDSPCAFVSCDRPTVAYSKNGKLLFSVANVSDVTAMTPFHTESFPDCLALSSDSGLRIGTIDEIQKIHIQTIHLGESPRRLCHCPRTGLFAVCTQKTIANADNVDETVDRVVVFEDGTMAQIHAVELDPFETALSCHCLSVDIAGNGFTREFVVVGTAFAIPDEHEPSRGRLLVFEVQEDQDRRVALVTTRELKGAVYCVTDLRGKVLAGVGSKVQLFKWVLGDTALAQPELLPEAAHKGCILALYVRTYGDFVVVGDLMRSITLLQYSAAEGSLVEVARDYSAHYMRGVEALNEEYFLGAEDFGNLFIVHRQAEAAAEEDRSRLELHAEFHLGDFVNVLRRGSLNSQPPEATDGAATGLVGQKPAMFGTVSGSLGAIIPVSEETFRFFSAVEKAVNIVVPGVGGLSHTDFRSFYNERRHSPQRNFVDGDLVETFLDLSPENMALAVKHLNDDTTVGGLVPSSGAPLLTVDEVSHRVEEMARLH